MHFKQPADAVNKLRGWLGMDDVVLFKGSRGARVEQILHSLAEDTDVTTGGC
jgi:UDP-N-acetylmuramyl pentapeptide synthase